MGVEHVRHASYLYLSDGAALEDNVLVVMSTRKTLQLLLCRIEHFDPFLDGFIVYPLNTRRRLFRKVLFCIAKYKPFKLSLTRFESGPNGVEAVQEVRLVHDTGAESCWEVAAFPVDSAASCGRGTT